MAGDSANEQTCGGGPPESGLAAVGVGFGAEAREALADFVQRAKTDDPLAAVTVVVPSNYTGLSLRRELGRRGGGIAVLETVTVAELADRLGGSWLQQRGRRPLSDMAVTAAVRIALGDDPGPFGPVVGHQQTARALGRTYSELRDLSESQLDDVAGTSPRAAGVVDICRRVRESLRRDWYDEFDLMAAAADQIGSFDELPHELGRICVYLPRRLNQHESCLLRALGRVPADAPVELLLGLTGCNSADSVAEGVCKRLRVEPPHLDDQRPDELREASCAERIVSVTDADEEARTVVRSVIADLDEGLPPSRIAVYFGAAEPYGRTLEDQFAAVGVATYGNTARRLAESVYGRFALGLAALADAYLEEPRLERRDVFDLLAGARVPRRRPRDPDTEQSGDEHFLVPDSMWERLARAAHVVGGDDWSSRLRRYGSELRELASSERSGDDPSLARCRWLEREAAECDAVSAFMAELRERLVDGRKRHTWRGLCDWMRSSLHRYLGAVGSASWLGDWPEWEISAAERVEGVLERLSDLGAIEPRISFDTMCQTLEVELAQPHGRSGTEGKGVYVGPLAGALDVTPDRSYIVGLAEGIVPARPQPDSLVDDDERRSSGGALRLHADDAAESHRTLLAAIAGTREHCTLSAPRGNLRQNAEYVPSRWMADTARRLDTTGRYFADGCLDAENLRAAALDDTVSGIVELPSFLSAVRSCGFPSAQWEYDAASLLAASPAELGHQMHPMFADPVFRRGFELSAARRSTAFTRFDGNLSGVIDSDSAIADVVSATRLETWASCPRRYLFEQLLGVSAITEPEQILRLSALDRGRLVHEAVDRFYRPLIANRQAWSSGEPMPNHGPGRAPPGPGRSPTDEDRSELVRLGQELASEAEERGVVGLPLLWQRDREALLADLGGLLDHDGQRDPRSRGEIQSSEFRFGFDDSAPAVSYRLDDGSEIRFRGIIDRVERIGDGSLVVIDYKTGATDSYKDIVKGSGADPTVGGTKLQLPVYALAARAHFGGGTANATAVLSAYWFISSRRGRWEWLELPVDDAVMTRFAEAVSVITAGIRSGVFAGFAQPSDDRRHYRVCPYCDPDGLGTADIRHSWRRKRGDPALAAFAELVEPAEVQS
ncbi:PD-(D/E)XK nuclease family protein [Candidatus Poriferisodalis sp.]|uniref:PD-(D/E)XK nuclease family protein n=1 Tax=Candidatus Poriferisodalis sp. TaxID=3101277 RepID=UPI003B02CDCF